MGSRGGNDGLFKGLLKAGLLNEHAPDLRDLTESFTRKGMEAYCRSLGCAGKNLYAAVRITVVTYPESDCPGCGSALIWRNPGRKGKRRSRYKDAD